MSVRRFVLASQSPRRRQILTISGYEFDILPSQISEIPIENLNLTSQIRQLASDKAEACLKMGKLAEGHGFLVLASDTVVVLGDQILGKPKDEFEARSFLSRLSNQTHDVITAVSLIDVDTGRRHQDHAVTRVKFHELSVSQIDAYVATGDPLDKAGAYGIQNALASGFIEKFAGDYDTVVGLSMAIVEKALASLGVTAAKRFSEGRGSPIGENILKLGSEIAHAALAPERAIFKDRSKMPARLVAVSKTKPATDVIDAWLAGQRIFAENYVQEALPKVEEVNELIKIAKSSPILRKQFQLDARPDSENEIEWHFIGTLQSKKAKHVVGSFSLIHSVDRISLVEEIEKRALALSKERSDPSFRQPILLQINIADETTKAGASAAEFVELFDAAVKCPHIKLCGVMALPPLTDDEALARARFQEIRAMFGAARGKLSANLQQDFCELSMGTTHDFKLAIAEGATLVRIGTAIFGERS